RRVLFRSHGDLAMEFQVGWQNYGKCRARNNRRNCVLHIDAVKHVNGLLWIRGRRWERVCRAELIALSNVGGRIDALGTRAHLNGDGGRCGAMHSMGHIQVRSEEHTSELQSRGHLVCRLLLEKKNRL